MSLIVVKLSFYKYHI